MLKTHTVRTVAIAAVAAIAGLGIGAAIASQPQMEGALNALQSASANLERVTLDKGGHANRARHLVTDAIARSSWELNTAGRTNTDHLQTFLHRADADAACRRAA